jgi:phosphatidylserine/phosphatidylglycerophosphate/cardiolipin synthase-like enzyme
LRVLLKPGIVWTTFFTLPGEMKCSKELSAVNRFDFVGQSTIEDLESPDKFVNTLFEGVQNAKEKVIMSALYLGTDALELKLLHLCEEALSDSTRPNLEISFIFDHSRAQRGNNVTRMFSRLVDQYHPRLQIFMYQMPQLRNFYCQYLPFPLREALGVYHCKFYIFDDHLLLSGANMSHEYFTSRQDRYFLLSPAGSSSSCKGAPFQSRVHDKLHRELSSQPGTSASAVHDPVHRTFVQYLYAFVDAVSSDCHQLLPGGLITEPRLIPGGSGSAAAAAGGSTKLLHDKLALLVPSINKANANQVPHKEEETEEEEHAHCTDVYPLIQHAPLGIFQESDAISSLLDAPFVQVRNALLCVATPYTNFRSTLLKTLMLSMQKGCTVELTTPSVPAHGFGSAKGLKGYIPALHYYSLQHEVQQIAHSISAHGGGDSGDSDSMDPANSSNASTEEFLLDRYNSYYYMKPDWTFHTKGLWIFPPSIASSLLQQPLGTLGTSSTAPEEAAATMTVTRSASVIQKNSGQRDKHRGGDKDTHSDKEPVITYIGSSNFGERSWSRDFELGFVFVTYEPKVKELFKHEYDNMVRWCGSEPRQTVPSVGTGTSAGFGNGVKLNDNKLKFSQRLAPTPQALLPKYGPVQQWLLCVVARIIKSFL